MVHRGESRIRMTARDLGSTPPAAPRTSPEFLSVVVERISHPIFVKDREYRFVFINAAFEKLTGRPFQELIGRTDHELFPTEQADFARAKDAEMFSSGEMVEVTEELMTGADGKTHVLSTTKVPLRGTDGEVTHLIGIIHDITPLKEAQQALFESKAELERRVQLNTLELKRTQRQLLHKERLTVLGQLAAGLAHQLRNPLASITNAASVIENRLQSGRTGDSRIAIGIIKEEVQVANQIITDLLDYARVRPPIPQEVVLRDLVESVLDAFPVPTGVALRRRIPLELSLVVDGDQLRGALRNLVRNAFEAMPQGGELFIDAELEDDEIRILVRDTGEGIPGDLRAQVFDPLVSSKPLGLGLGLTTARMLVENQGGALACLDTEGSGATFELRLPLEPPPGSSQIF
jgi:PAS domain S-box-containing protein